MKKKTNFGQAFAQDIVATEAWCTFLWVLHLVPTHDMRLYRNVHQIFSSYQWKQRRICCSLATDTEVSTATPPHYRAASLLRPCSRFRGVFFICQDLKFFQWHQACQANFVACVGFKYFPLSLTLLKKVDKGKVSVKKCWVWQRSITRTHCSRSPGESWFTALYYNCCHLKDSTADGTTLSNYASKTSCCILVIPVVHPPPPGNKTLMTARHTLKPPMSHLPGECGLRPNKAMNAYLLSSCHTCTHSSA